MKRELGRRVGALEHAVRSHDREEFAQVLAELSDEEIVKAHEVHRRLDLWERCVELVVSYHLAGARPAEALGRAATEVHAEAVAAGRFAGCG